MSLDDRSTENQIAHPPEPLKAGRGKKPPKNLIRWLGGGCLGIVACLAVSIIALYFSGLFSGTHGNEDSAPSWSPDGSRIAFVSDRDGNYDIFIMNADGSQVKQLTRDPFAQLYLERSPADFGPAWSPDGKKIAFSSGRDNTMWSFVSYNIYTMNPDGSQVVNLTHTTEIMDYPAWSPDGKRIAFAYKKMFGSNSMIENPIWSLYAMDANGANITHVGALPGHELHPDWSPDNSQIAFTCQMKGTPAICMINTSGPPVHVLSGLITNDWDPNWSPDGSRIAFVSDRTGKEAIYVMNADGSNMVRLTNGKADAYDPAWSPDGSQIAYTSNQFDDIDIFVMNVDGSNVRRLTGK